MGGYAAGWADCNSKAISVQLNLTGTGAGTVLGNRPLDNGKT